MSANGQKFKPHYICRYCIGNNNGWCHIKGCNVSKTLRKCDYYKRGFYNEYAVKRYKKELREMEL